MMVCLYVVVLGFFVVVVAFSSTVLGGVVGVLGPRLSSLFGQWRVVQNYCALQHIVITLLKTFGNYHIFYLDNQMA